LMAFASDSAAPQPMRVDAARLTEAIARIFAALGLERTDADVVAGDLVAADLEGIASHGVMLVPMYVERLLKGSVSRRRQGDVVSDHGAAIVIDAAHALGQLTARQAVGLAVARARDLGAAVVAVRNAFHFGTAGRYARMMAEQGCAGMVMSNTRPLMPAPGAAEPRSRPTPSCWSGPTITSPPSRPCARGSSRSFIARPCVAKHEFLKHRKPLPNE
jgi:LDH2 family malate/lactate/ureidoglycolate dehydrogenase